VAEEVLILHEDIPILYFPWATFAVKKGGQTGFLITREAIPRIRPEVKNRLYWDISKIWMHILP